jgi:hypothetical protein
MPKNNKPIWGKCPICGGDALGNYKGRAGYWKCANIKCHIVFKGQGKYSDNKE